MRSKKIWAAILTAVMSVSVLAGCGGSGESSSQTSEPAAVEETEMIGADVEATTELTDNTINVGYGTAIDSLTPFRSATARNAPYLDILYERLAVRDSNNEYQPYAAKSWETTDNGYTYDLEIWDNISDSQGNAITAADIVWFIQEAKNRGLITNFSKVESVEQTGDYTLQIKFSDNRVGVFETLMEDTFVVSQAAFEASADEFATSCVSTSPYVCTEFVPSASLTFERRDDYWQDIANMPECVRPIQKTVNYQIITEASQMGIALETGTIDVAIDIAASTGAQFVDQTDAYTVNLQDGAQGWQVFFSGAENSILAENEALRQAICYAIDADGLVQGLCSGYGTPMWDVCAPRLIGFLDKWKDEDYYTYDVEKAQQLIEESGYNGETLTLLSSSSATASTLGQLIQNYLDAVGIKVELNAVDMALYTATRLDGTQYDMVLGTVGGTYLSDVWSLRFDPAAYEAGDATSRNDQELADLLYSTWTNEGYTDENIDEVHTYIKDSAYGYGLVNPQVFTIWRNDLGMVKAVTGGINNYVMPSACQFTRE